MTTPVFSLSDLLSRVQSVRVAPPPPVVLSMQAIVRKDTERNARSVQAIIDESGELDCHSFDVSDNLDSLAIAE